MVEKCCGCTCPSDVGLRLIIIKPVGDPLGFRMGLLARPLLMQSLSSVGDPSPSADWGILYQGLQVLGIIRMAC
jgi:hypothetical protein